MDVTSSQRLIDGDDSSPRNADLVPPVASVEFAAEAADADSDAEVGQLEALLAVRARELSAMRVELTRVQGLLRDAVAHFETTLVDQSASADTVELTRQRDLAVTRALEAEAGRAELRFRLDELMGHLAAPGDDGMPGESLEVTCARLAGTVRGLRSALADVEESRDVADARRMLLEQDLDHVQAQAHGLERGLAEAREHAELELVRARGLAGQLEQAVAAREAGQRQLTEVSARLTEEARLRAEAHEALHKSHELAEQTRREFELSRQQEAAVATDHQENSSQISQLEQLLARETETCKEMGAQLARAAAEAIALRDELTRARTESAELQRAVERTGGERGRILDELGVERDIARRDAAEQRSQAERLAGALREVRQALSELPPSMQRVTLAAATSTVERPDGPISDAPTAPGMPSYIEGLEGLEEQVTRRDERIVELSNQLARERGRLATTARMLRELRDQQGVLPSREVNELLSWLDPSRE